MEELTIHAVCACGSEMRYYEMREPVNLTTAIEAAAHEKRGLKIFRRRMLQCRVMVWISQDKDTERRRDGTRV